MVIKWNSEVWLLIGLISVSVTVTKAAVVVIELAALTWATISRVRVRLSLGELVSKVGSRWGNAARHRKIGCTSYCVADCGFWGFCC